MVCFYGHVLWRLWCCCCCVRLARCCLSHGRVQVVNVYILHYATTNCVCLAENIRNSHRQVIMSSQAPSQVKGESQVVKAEADPAYINLKVKQQVSPALRIIISAALTHKAYQDGAITHFRIKRSTQMRKVTSPLLHEFYILHCHC